MKLPGEKDVDTTTAGATPGAGAKPSGTMAEQRTITVTITEIDPKVPSITFKGPNNWTYSSRVEDKQALAKVKVGDKAGPHLDAGGAGRSRSGCQEVARVCRMWRGSLHPRFAGVTSRGMS